LSNLFSRRRRGNWQYLLVVAIGISVYQYTQTGAVTWPLEALRELRELVYDYRAGSGAPANEAPSNTTPAGEAPATDLAGRVTKVADGDTFTLALQGNRKLRVRLYGIDAPEHDQPYGQAARTALNDKLLGHDVRIMLHDVDTYGRMVSTVYLDGRDINLEQVQSGLAWWYRDYAPNDQAIRDAEADAQRQHQGLWHDAKPTPPWEWRHNKK
jgi:endonuclease YncB( thermonuclease family)